MYERLWCMNVVGSLDMGLVSRDSPIVVCDSVTYLVHELGNTATYVFVSRMIGG